MGVRRDTGAVARFAGRLVPTGIAAPVGLQRGDFRLRDAVSVARHRRRGPIQLTLDLTAPLRPAGDGLASLRARGRPTLREVLDALAWAARDPMVVALHARVGGAPGGLATVQEIAAAVRRVADAGTPTVAHSEVFGEGGNGTLAYLLATAFGEVHLQPSGELALLGVAGEVTFLRGALDKVGIEPQFEHRHEYKNASDVFTEREFTSAHREALDSLVDDWATQVTAAIAAARELDVAAVRAAMDDAPLSPSEALDRGLVDRLSYLDESLEALSSRVTSDAALTPIGDYHASVAPRHRWAGRHAPVVAMIRAAGMISVRRSGAPLPTTRITSDRLCAELRAAVADDDVAAIVLHVDSPGGSAVASDAIRREVRRARDAGIPVVAWMGDVAGSGGYYIAMAADQIVARPGTLTGSIGVLGGKPVNAELKRKLGLHTEAVTAGAHARFHSGSVAYSDSERRRLNLQLDRIYDDFTGKVAHDRGLDPAQVHTIARGRVWTGTQAHARGLVDRLGGYQESLEATRDLLGLPDGAPLRVRQYPPSRSPLARLRGTGPTDPAEQDVLAAVMAVPTDLDAWLELVRTAGRPRGALLMPWVPRIR